MHRNLSVNLKKREMKIEKRNKIGKKKNIMKNVCKNRVHILRYSVRKICLS